MVWTYIIIAMGLQLVISLGFIYLCPNTIMAHWIYLIGAGLVLVAAYIFFMKKNYIFMKSIWRL